MKDRCTNCQRVMSCSASEEQDCWCSAFPLLIKLEEALGEQSVLPAASCLCNNCLLKKLKVLTENYVEAFKAGRITNRASSLAGNSRKPIRGIDYEIENGFWVFSGWNHLKRGYCCGSGCRNCPYPKTTQNA